MDAEWLRGKHEAGLDYESYLATGTDQQRADWSAVYERAGLTERQRELVAGFTREMKVIVLSGIWCGDCVQQCPLIQRIAEANPARIDLRYLDRDEHDDLQQRVLINAGRRVPVVLFLAEDYELVGWYGDRVLARYRAMAQQRLGAACPMPGAPVGDDELAATLQDWLDELERAQLVLRLSARLREKHGD